jgi:hypothetical protein
MAAAAKGRSSAARSAATDRPAGPWARHLIVLNRGEVVPALLLYDSTYRLRRGDVLHKDFDPAVSQMGSKADIGGRSEKVCFTP